MKYAFVLLALLSSGALFSQKQWTLEDCVKYAMDNNISVQQGQLSEELAEIDLKQAKGNILPNLNGSATHAYNWGRNIDPITNSITTERIQRNSFGFNSNFTLYSGLRNYNSLKQSELSLKTSQIQNEVLQNDIALSVANAYLTVLFNQEFVNIAQRNLDVTNQQVDQTQKLVDAGQLPEGNLFEVLAQQATDEAALLSAENNLDISILALTQIMQLPYADAKNFDVVVPDLNQLGQISMPQSLDIVVSNALKNYPTMELADAQLLVSEMGLKIAQGARQPTLNLNYGLNTGYSDQNIIGLGDQVTLSQQIGTVEGTGESVFSVPQTFFSDFGTKPFNDQFNDNINHGLSLSLSIPIFNGWNATGNIERAKINILNSELDRDNTKNTLVQNIERAWADAEVALRNFEASEKTVNASQKAYEYAEVQFTQGVINQLDFNQARTRLDNAQTDLIRNKYDYIFRVKILDFYQGKPITLN